MPPRDFEEFSDVNRPKTAPYTLRFLRRFVLPGLDLSGGFAADLCCGTGSVVALLAEETRLAVGIDIGARFIGADCDAERARFVVADCTELPLTDDSIDLVTHIDSIQYFRDIPGALAEVRRVLRPGGRLLISAVNHKNPFGIKRRIMESLTGRPWSPWVVHPVDQPVTYDSLLRDLKASGFAIEHTWGVDFLSPWVHLLPDGVRKMRLAGPRRSWFTLQKMAERMPVMVLADSPLKSVALKTYVLARKPEQP